MRKIILVIVIGALAWQGLKKLRPDTDKSAPAQVTTAAIAETSPENPSIPSFKPTASPAFVCDGRTYCSQMSSCEEAKYFLQHCPGVKMDGDNDGIPCERQWCS
jgi:hypothetical protein